jgi:hypothetical protein
VFLSCEPLGDCADRLHLFQDVLLLFAVGTSQVHVCTIAAGNVSENIQFKYPSGIAIDGEGNVAALTMETVVYKCTECATARIYAPSAAEAAAIFNSEEADVLRLTTKTTLLLRPCQPPCSSLTLQ